MTKRAQDSLLGAGEVAVPCLPRVRTRAQAVAHCYRCGQDRRVLARNDEIYVFVEHKKQAGVYSIRCPGSGQEVAAKNVRK